MYGCIICAYCDMRFAEIEFENSECLGSYLEIWVSETFHLLSIDGVKISRWFISLIGEWPWINCNATCIWFPFILVILCSIHIRYCAVSVCFWSFVNCQKWQFHAFTSQCFICLHFAVLQVENLFYTRLKRFPTTDIAVRYIWCDETGLVNVWLFLFSCKIKVSIYMDNTWRYTNKFQTKSGFLLLSITFNRIFLP